MLQKRWLYVAAIVWTGLVTLIPAVFGVIMVHDHTAVTTPGVTATDVFGAMAYRNFAFSLVLLGALALQLSRGHATQALAFLLLARGLTEVADGVSGTFAAGPGPFIGGTGDVLFAAYFFLRARGP
jgi:hypothetical protein